MGHILTPEFFAVFKDQQDCPDPVILKKLVHLHTSETYFLFHCSEEGMAYGYVMGEDIKNSASGSIPVFELEQKTFPFVRRSGKTIMLPIIADDHNFQPKSLDKAKYEYQKEREVDFPERKTILFKLMYPNNPVLMG